MATWWKPWTWVPGSSHADNFVRNINLQDGTPRPGLTSSPEAAVEVTAVLCAVRVIAEGMAQMPLKLYREREVAGRTKREVAKDNPLHQRLHRRPNGWMTSFQWRETMTMHAVLGGNGYSVISRVGGDVDELIPVDPACVQIGCDQGEIRYRIAIDGRTMEFAKKDVFHLRGPSLDGKVGLNILRLAREAVGLTGSLEQAQRRLQQNGGRPSGILTYSDAGTLSSEAKQALRDSWNDKFGPGGEGGVAVLDNGWAYNSITMSAVDAQLIETRRFQIDEIGRAFRVWPLMLMQADKTATFASSEQFFLAHVIHTLGPWIERWENTLDCDLVDDPDLYAHFMVNGLMRGAAKDRGEFYAKALGAGGAPGWATQNEIRGWEDLDPLEGGDELFRGSQNAEPISAADLAA